MKTIGRLLTCFTNKPECLVHDCVVRVRFATATANVAVEFDLFAIAYQVGRIERVGVDLVVVAKENIKAVFLWNAG